MVTLLQIYSVQRIGPANPNWAIYYFKAIVHNPNEVIIYVNNASFKTIDVLTQQSVISYNTQPTISMVLRMKYVMVPSSNI